MQVRSTNGPRAVLRVVGSLWFAAVLLMLLLVAMACATVFESLHGTERALAAFYTAWWFQGLLWLLAINISAAVIARYPFSKRHIGFVITHLAILVTLAGGLITRQFGVEGYVGVAEGETVWQFSSREDALTIVNLLDQTHATVALQGPAFGGFRAVDKPAAPLLRLADVRVQVERYLPDSVWIRHISNDNPQPQCAVEVSLSASGYENTTWVFTDETVTVGPTRVALRVVNDSDELCRLLDEQPLTTQPASKGVVKVEYGGAVFEVPLEDCTGKVVPLGDTGYSVRVLQYLPHAAVGANNRLTNVSDRSINPAIEVEIAGPSETEKLIAFARFPGFQHKPRQIVGLDLTFVTPTDPAPLAPVEVLSGPDGDLYARFTREGAPARTDKLSVGTAVESPWPALKFAVLRCFDHARVEWSLEPADLIREARVPAIFVRVSTPEHSTETWAQKHRLRWVTLAGTPYELIYADKQVPLGFALTLDRFRVDHYPGTTEDRSIESHVTIVDPAAGKTQSRLISMNNPTEHRGYAFCQWSYDLDDEKAVSVLGVSRDPGQPIVFAGYIFMMIGMTVVLGTRIADRRRVARAAVVAQEVARR